MAFEKGGSSLQGFTRKIRNIVKIIADEYDEYMEEIADDLSIGERTLKEVQVNRMENWSVHTTFSVIN
jgi:hypothetical protein